MMMMTTVIINSTEGRTIFFFEVLEELAVIEETKSKYAKSALKVG